MIERQKWVDHKFDLGSDLGWTKNILSRIEDTVIRLEQRCKLLNNDQLSKRIDNAWSIKEHIGHLVDLEELWIGRFNAYPKRNKELVMADMSNQKTNKSNHNDETLESLLMRFKEERS